MDTQVADLGPPESNQNPLDYVNLAGSILSDLLGILLFCSQQQATKKDRARSIVSQNNAIELLVSLNPTTDTTTTQLQTYTNTKINK